MGSFDGAEICELVGLYLLDKLSTLFEKECVGLYNSKQCKWPKARQNEEGYHFIILKMKDFL